jgi:3-oxosteroid 1-dehydrogenase
MNDFAKRGGDPDFGRGDSEYDRYYGDPRVSPNPCLAPIDQAPFYAMPIDPGDFGTQGGLVTDVHARVQRGDGSTIEGLYAIGNCSAAVLPTYPGPGSTLGPAMTFGYLAARHLSGATAP